MCVRVCSHAVVERICNVQLSASAVLRHDVKGGVVFEAIKELQHVRVLEPTQDVHLAAEL